MDKNIIPDSPEKHAGDMPGPEIMSDIDEAIRLVLDEAPSDSGAELVVRKSKHGYKGLLTVHSSQGKFIGGYKDEQLAEVVKKIFSDVHDQIGDWKKHRLVQT